MSHSSWKAYVAMMSIELDVDKADAVLFLLMVSTTIWLTRVRALVGR